MNYYIAETYFGVTEQFTAGSKARRDVEHILSAMGYVEIKKNSNKEPMFTSLISHFRKYVDWKKCLEEIGYNDNLVIQFPVEEHTIFMENVIKKLTKKGVNVILFIHDLQYIRFATNKDFPLKRKIRLKMEEISCLKAANKIIAHNAQMRDYLINLGIEPLKIIVLKIFDYLIPNYSPRIISNNEHALIVAGNLNKNKAGYLYKIDNSIALNLYGIGYEVQERQNIHYYGTYLPDELPKHLVGKFGLVWDGDNAESCTGSYGEYLKLNNPHKASLYLAAGIPVVIWDKAALSDFVNEEKCGICIDSLKTSNNILSKISDEKYSEMKENALRVGKLMRKGYFLETAIKAAMR